MADPPAIGKKGSSPLRVTTATSGIRSEAAEVPKVSSRNRTWLSGRADTAARSRGANIDGVDARAEQRKISRMHLIKLTIDGADSDPSSGSWRSTWGQMGDKTLPAAANPPQFGLAIDYVSPADGPPRGDEGLPHPFRTDSAPRCTTSSSASFAISPRNTSTARAEYPAREHVDDLEQHPAS
jgi:hypothetical protein